MGRRLSLIERTMVFIITFFVVIWILSYFRIWQLELQEYLIRSERWLELVFIFALVTGITMILVKLLQWDYRIEARVPRRK